MSNGKITFAARIDSHLFARGDFISEGQIVLHVNHESGEITIGDATRWRRFWFGLRARSRHAWWWTRGTVADLWCRLWGLDP